MQHCAEGLMRSGTLCARLGLESRQPSHTGWKLACAKRRTLIKQVAWSLRSLGTACCSTDYRVTSCVGSLHHTADTQANLSSFAESTRPS